jgi:A/G-specific adenine glycosylase
MSQQTQVGRVGEALPRFLARFPDVPTLAAATTGDVVRAWGGLGYPRRAVALREAARLMVERHEGRVPRRVPELEALPGIGPYTARAIAATAFGVPVTALDVNARRVLGRVFDGGPMRPARSPAQQARADALAPGDAAADWNHGLMDLGATICRPLPACAGCPLARWCTAVAEAGQVGRPAPTRRAAPPFHATDRFVRGRVLATLREAPHGTWVTLDPATLGIAPERIERAAKALAVEGLLELAHPAARLEARLPTT